MYSELEYEENPWDVHFDLRTEVPGVLVYSQEERIHVIININEEKEIYKKSYKL